MARISETELRKLYKKAELLSRNLDTLIPHGFADIEMREIAKKASEVEVLLRRYLMQVLNPATKELNNG